MPNSKSDTVKPLVSPSAITLTSLQIHCDKMKENARVWLRPILWQKDSHALPRQRLPGNNRQESGYYLAWNSTMRWRHWSKTKPMNGNADLQTLKRIQTHLQVLQVHQRGLSGSETALLKTTRRVCYWNVKRISKQANAIYQGSNVGRAWCPTQSEVWLRGFGRGNSASCPVTTLLTNTPSHWTKPALLLD